MNVLLITISLVVWAFFFGLCKLGDAPTLNAAIVSALPAIAIWYYYRDPK